MIYMPWEGFKVLLPDKSYIAEVAVPLSSIVSMPVALSSSGASTKEDILLLADFVIAR